MYVQCTAPGSLQSRFTPKVAVYLIQCHWWHKTARLQWSSLADVAQRLGRRNVCKKSAGYLLWLKGGGSGNSCSLTKQNINSRRGKGKRMAYNLTKMSVDLAWCTSVEVKILGNSRIRLSVFFRPAITKYCLGKYWDRTLLTINLSRLKISLPVAILR